MMQSRFIRLAIMATQVAESCTTPHSEAYQPFCAGDRLALPTHQSYLWPAGDASKALAFAKTFIAKLANSTATIRD